MRKFIFVFASLSVLLCLVLSSCTGVEITYENANKYQAGDAELSADDSEKVKNIDLDWLSGDVKIRYHDEKTLSVTEDVNGKTLSDEEKMYWYLDGETLRIRYAQSGYKALFKTSGTKKNLTLTLPRNFEGGNLSVALASAKIESDELNFEKIDVSSASGNIDLNVCKADKLDIGTASGKIDIKADEIRKLDLSTASGNANIIVNKVVSIDISSSSGKIELNGKILGETEISTSSGKIFVTAEEEIGVCDISSSSGGVNMLLPEKLEFTLDIDTASGDFDSDFAYVSDGNRRICGDGDVKIAISTSSGDISVCKNVK